MTGNPLFYLTELYERIGPGNLKVMQGVLPRLEVEDRIVMHKDPQEARQCFDELVAANPDLRIELQGDGTIIVMAPAGGESDYQNSEVVIQLGNWAKADGRGKAFGGTLGCNLPDGSTLSPDAAWIPNHMLNALPKAARRKYLPLVPPFVVEVKSPSDSKKELRAKCRQWIANGAELVWFINGDDRTVWEYFGDTEQLIEDAETLNGKGPIQGFVLDLRPIWEGL
ncbi:MAG: Uma2 family endonuclease [Acidobacteriaceae bacterium]|nr:Uma2 family endonuclease [Acidobacteriaceae bacterium]